MLKRWRYVGVYAADLMLCAGAARIGPARQSWWAVWERDRDRLHERTRLRPGGPVHLADGRVRVHDGSGRASTSRSDDAGAREVEVVTPDGRGYAWTRKRAPVRARGTVRVDGEARTVDAAALIDESAGYHARHTAWRWSAGVGTRGRRRRAGGVEPRRRRARLADRERAHRVGRRRGARGRPGRLRRGSRRGRVRRGRPARFRTPRRVRARNDNLLVVRSDYEQPFGTFHGTLPGGLELAEGYGVMERHVAVW